MLCNRKSGLAKKYKGIMLINYTRDKIMGGRVTIFQPTDGYRVGIDPVFLAAAIPAKPGNKILDVGSGTGAASLVLALRCSDVFVIGLELQGSLVDLADDSAKETGLDDRVKFIEGDLLKPPKAFLSDCFDHVMANPPYFREGQGNFPKDFSKKTATIEGSAILSDWLKFLLTCLCDKGTLTIIHRYDRSEEVMASLKTFGAGNIVIFPLWQNKINKEAKRVIIQAQKGVAWTRKIRSGLILHEKGGVYTAKAEEVLREGKALMV
jgi:tRNA1(Val) A37 N6-methylase TrmN6